MLKEQAGNSIELPHQGTGEYLEHGYRKIVREAYETIYHSTLENFTLSLIDSLWNDLNVLVYDLECLPEVAFKALIEVIMSLREAKNELRLARFLFDEEEIDPVRRFVMRNKAVIRSKTILHKILLVWPLYN